MKLFNKSFQRIDTRNAHVCFGQYTYVSGLVTPLTVFDATFFPPAKELENYIEQTNGLLKSLITNDILRTFVIKDAIRDLRAAGATLVVSSIEESKSSLYWYYVSEGQIKNQLLDRVISTLLRRGP